MAAPIEDVAKVMPSSIVYTPGGTRRKAAFEGMHPWNQDYLSWTRARAVESFDMLFRYGVTHLISPGMTPGNWQETDEFRNQLLERADWAFASPEALADYARYGWRVRLIGAESIPELQPTAQRLIEETPNDASHTLWWTARKETDDPWLELIAVIHRSGAQTRGEAIRALFGEDIPPVALYIGFGKLLVSSEILPPILIGGKLQCYWSETVGYSTSESWLRSILYDYAYVRNTWREQKIDRAREALAHQAVWERGPTIGLGTRLGPFWYPASTPSWEELGD